LLRKPMVLVVALLTALILSMPVALAEGKSDPKCWQTGPPVGCNGHKGDDGADANEGGGNDHIKQNNGKGND
jgi:hypothetical protein